MHPFVDDCHNVLGIFHCLLLPVEFDEDSEFHAVSLLLLFSRTILVELQINSRMFLQTSTEYITHESMSVLYLSEKAVLED